MGRPCEASHGRNLTPLATGGSVYPRPWTRERFMRVANGDPLAIDASAGGEQMMVGLLRLRFAAGVCVLAAGLLMGAGGAVAVADPGSSGSAAHGDDGTNASGQQQSTGAKKPK